MSKIREILKNIAVENKISLQEDNMFNMSDEEYLNELKKWREEEEDDRNALYDYSGSWKSYDTYKKPQELTKAEPQQKSMAPSKKEVNPDRLQFYKFRSRMNRLLKNLETADDYSDINEWAQELDNLRKKIKSLSGTNPYLKSLVDESLFNEGDKKIFDKNSGYNVSEDENFYYNMIKKKWPDAEKSKTFDDFRNPENHRPWQVDIYIPSEKMMIMIQKNWKHGRRPYNADNTSCQKDVSWLKSKKGDYYDKVLYTWTELDPLKRKLAKELGYKYIEIFNMDEFLKWYNNPELTYEEYKCPVALKYDSDEYFRQKANHRDIYGNDSAWDE